MSRTRLATLLLFVVAVAGMVVPGVAVVASRRTGHNLPPLLDCGPAPTLSKNADATFRADLASALAALPSAVAAKRDAFAAVQTGRALARGACFAANASSSPGAARACKACLSTAGRDVTGGCRDSGRAGVWRHECFLSYADSNASTAREDAFRGWLYAGTRATAALAAGACLADRAVDCDRCWRDSARAAAALGWWQKIHGEEVVVVGYSCFIRFQVSSLPDGRGSDVTVGDVIFYAWLELVFLVAAVTLEILFIRIIMIVSTLPQVNAG